VEIRVPDTQASVQDTAAVAAVCHALVVHLARRVEGGEAQEPAPGWRIAENRWSACRYGPTGIWRDVRTGRSEPTAERLHRLLDDLAPSARSIGCARELEDARDLIDRPRAAWARAVVADGGAPALVRWLANRFPG